MIYLKLKVLVSTLTVRTTQKHQTVIIPRVLTVIIQLKYCLPLLQSYDNIRPLISATL